MATDAVRYRRQSRQTSARAAKERREKIILVVGFALLIGVVAFEGPKMLKRLHGSTAATAPAAAISPGAVAVPVAPAKPVSLKPLAHFKAKDPFVPQVSPSVLAGHPLAPATAPAVRSSHFVQKDPFVQQLGVVTGAAAGPGAGSSKGSETTPVAGVGSFIVVVASVPVASGVKEAKHEAAVARGHGVPAVKVVVSSDYPTLREGYYAVYSGPYKSLRAALQMVERIRGLGYVSAYTRRLGH